MASSTGPRPSWPNGSGPRVYAYLKYPGSKNHDSFLETLRQIAKTKLPTLAYISNASQKLQKEFTTETLSIQLDPIDLDYACQECDVAILNGGHGTTVRFALAGKPLLILPNQLEQEVTADRVAQYGLGSRSTWRSPPSVPRALTRLVSESAFRRAAEQLAACYPNWCPETQADRATESLVDTATQCQAEELVIV